MARSAPPPVDPRASAGTSTPRATPARATLDSVAALAGVSRQTVSNVINAPAMVRPDTRSRVEEAITRLGYRPNLAARQLRTRRSRLLGMRVEQDPNPTVFDALLHAVTAEAARHDYRVMLYTAADEDAEIAACQELLDRWDVDAVLLTGSHAGDTRAHRLAGLGLPFVTFGRPWEPVDAHPWVDVDGAAGTRLATEHLLARGHRRIGFLGWPAGSGSGDDRAAGWSSTMAGAGLPVIPPARSLNDVVDARRAAAALLDEHGATAVVCVSDVVAIGVLAELGARGLRPGTDVGVVGFDDSEGARVAGLTSVAQPLLPVARHCLRIVLDAIHRSGAEPGGARAGAERIGPERAGAERAAGDPAGAVPAPTEHLLLTPTLTVRVT